MSDRKYYLSGVLGYIAEEVSLDAAIKLGKARYGRAVHIPATPKPNHVLSTIVGVQDAIKISKVLGSGEITVPCGNFGGEAGRRSRILELHQQGLKYSAIAAEVDVHMRTVERVLSGVDVKDDKQTSFLI